MSTAELADRGAPPPSGVARPILVHLTTTDISLELLLGPQLEAFLAAGYDVRGASRHGPFVEALTRRGVAHVPLAHATREMAPVEDAKALRELVQLFRRVKPTIVHTHNPKPGVYGRVAARIAGVPVIVNTVHGLFALPRDRLAKRATVYGLERLAAACSDAELVQNPEDIAVLHGLRVPERKVRLLGNGIDLQRFDPASVTDADAHAARIELGGEEPGTVVVGLVGRLVREKGYPEVFEAARRLRERASNVRVAVIGPDDDAKADALGAHDRSTAEAAGVRFLGSRDDVVRLYGGMDIYVLASHREGFPRSAMEAAAMGLPIVATDIRGCRQVVEHGVTGLLVPSRDPAALADAIETLATEPTLRRTMGDAARVKARCEFDQQRCIDITLDTYRELLERQGLPLPTPVS